MCKYGTTPVPAPTTTHHPFPTLFTIDSRSTRTRHGRQPRAVWLSSRRKIDSAASLAAGWEARWKERDSNQRKTHFVRLPERVNPRVTIGSALSFGARWKGRDSNQRKTRCARLPGRESARHHRLRTVVRSTMEGAGFEPREALKGRPPTDAGVGRGALPLSHPSAAGRWDETGINPWTRSQRRSNLRAVERPRGRLRRPRSRTSRRRRRPRRRPS